MPRIFIAASLLMAALAVRAADSAEALLARGLTAYRAANFTAAAIDLENAARAYLSPDAMAQYVNTGRYESSESLETALVYLALAHFRLGREEAARETIHRLVAAERITPVYAALPLAADAADFESLAAALLPGSGLPRNMHLASEDPSRPLPPVRRAAETTPTQRQEVADALTPRAAENVFTETPPRAATPATPTATPVSAQTPTPVASSAATREGLTTLRQAEDAAAGGDVQSARTLYVAIARTPEVSREVIGEAAAGLYRVGAYRESAEAFRRFGNFARGEEDLRYYFAVALYESGEYGAAERELACALPYLEATEDVLRYRWKIENTAAVVAMK
ncbi:MAG TPA: hypothetical protein VHW00_17470 [Thermoanaerobaculia bacterium]|nr:hypothetical protein [Thermoanaerobaculia bacterium]